MSDHTPRLSDLADQLDARERRLGVAEPSDAAVLALGIDLSGDVSNRRTFLARASALSLAIPGVGAALASCSPSGGPAQADSSRAATKAAPPATIPREPHNSDSRLDSAVLKPEHRAATSGTGGAAQAAQNVAFKRYDPTLPPLAAAKGLQLHWHAHEAAVRIMDDTVVAAWTFEGDFPGPIVHCRVGDTVEFTLTNDVDIPHSMDFHAAQIDPKIAFRSAAKGQSVTFTFKPRWAGGFMYHCGTAPVLMHIGSGMHGAIIVSPREPLAAGQGVRARAERAVSRQCRERCSRVRLSEDARDGSRFRHIQRSAEPIREGADSGEASAIECASGSWRCGPTHPCHFHVVGEQFDTVYLGAPPANAIRGVQTFSVAAGGGMCYELVCDIAGEFPFVNHGFGHGQKGAMGVMVVEA